MAYEIAFSADVTVTDPGVYINDCCWGGDVIRDKLLPVVIAGYDSMRTGQEDWGWYIWMGRERQKTHIDIFCDDQNAREFRIHLYGARRKGFRLKLEDGEDIELLKAVIAGEIKNWGTVTSAQKYTLTS